MNKLEEIRAHSTLTFTVAAGKYDGWERNCKYVESFATLDEAIEAYDKVSDYPWVQIEYGCRIFQLQN